MPIQAGNLSFFTTYRQKSTTYQNPIYIKTPICFNHIIKIKRENEKLENTFRNDG